MGSVEPRITIMTVDDHAALREGIAALVRSSQALALVGQASDGREAVDRYRALRPDITLMDLAMPVMNGIDATIAICAEHPGARIIVVTTFGGSRLVQRAIDAGAWGFVLKSHIRRDLLRTICAVHSGHCVIRLSDGAGGHGGDPTLDLP
jgi:DNA-binding NarL/FixJ family response regulator